MDLRGVLSKPEMQPFRRFAAIALSACLAETLVVLYAKKPLPLAGIVARACRCSSWCWLLSR